MTIQTDQTKVRLYITPFSADLLDRIVPASVQSKASNISFHSVQTYPERGFGYIDLPANDAKNLRAKFNGSTLRGAKVKIEEAKPEKPGMGGKRKSADAPQTESGSKKRVKRDKNDRTANVEGVLAGFELPPGRSVRRGWEDRNSLPRKSRQKPQPETDNLSHKRHIVKVALPPNVPTRSITPAKSKARPPANHKTSVTVKEFKHTTKPLARPLSQPHVRAITYEEGIGWVDSTGTVVEKAPTRRQGAAAGISVSTSKAAPSDKSGSTGVASATEPDSGSDISGSASSASEISSDSELDDDSDNSDNSDDPDDSHESGNSPTDISIISSADTSAHAVASESMSPDSGSQPAEDHRISPKEIHPLEALFKRAPATSEPGSQTVELAPIETKFSFFGEAGDEDVELEADSNIPQTPHSKNELELRSIRSAAPTPDTAAIGKRFTFPIERSESPHAVQELEDSAATARDALDGDHEESEFRRWFYNSRGDLNRAWKRRRREEKKLKRQRESRRLGRKLA